MAHNQSPSFQNLLLGYLLSDDSSRPLYGFKSTDFNLFDVNDCKDVDIETTKMHICRMSCKELEEYNLGFFADVSANVDVFRINRPQIMFALTRLATMCGRRETNNKTAKTSRDILKQIIQYYAKNGLIDKSNFEALIQLSKKSSGTRQCNDY